MVQIADVKTPPRLILVSLILIGLTIAPAGSSFLTETPAPLAFLKDVVISKAYSFGLVVSSLSMVNAMYLNIRDRKMAWYRPVTFFIAFAAIVFSGLVLGQESDVYLDLSNYLNTHGMALGYTLTCFAIIILIVTRLTRMLDGPHMFMAFTAFLVLFYLSAVGDWVPPIFSSIGEYFHDAIAIGGYKALWLASYFGMITWFVRLLMGKERMRVR
jgi:hypothetical protein